MIKNNQLSTDPKNMRNITTMKNTLLKKLRQTSLQTSLAICLLSLTACSTFFDKDNTLPPTPLTAITPSAQTKLLWRTRTGNGADGDFLRLTPALHNNQLVTASKNGTLTAVDKLSGKVIWSTATGEPLSSAPSIDPQGVFVFVGTQNGKLLAFNARDGKKQWEAKATSEILAAPATAKQLVIAKAIDGRLSAFTTATGHLVWRTSTNQPDLILRGSSAAVIKNGDVYAGFEDGSFVRFDLQSGSERWKTIIAEPTGIFPIQRMVDIVANPIVTNDRIYVATYQGKIAALSTGTGRKIWSHTLSSFTGMAYDGEKIYVSTADSLVMAFDAATGEPVWQQTKLTHRMITGPALMQHSLVVGDAEGWLHWLSTRDGHFVARSKVGSDGVSATPLVSNGTLYIFANDGRLSAWSLD